MVCKWTFSSFLMMQCGALSCVNGGISMRPATISPTPHLTAAFCCNAAPYIPRTRWQSAPRPAPATFGTQALSSTQ
ncbi:hypothetical protein E2C01_081945 [Portunus trituberculatus]|uniref:Secreted protein n=1 Tax=Portunus trituberculatus TaxID=210409 RepID=A0A5B7J3N7_PORTR|nr:hypothetical protein [Portunus trituberculatus]